MVALPDKVQRFAHWSGAKLRPQEPVALEIDLPNFVADSERSPEEEPTESLVESKFQKNNKPWKNPKITLATAVGLAAAISAIGFFAINSNIQWPSIGGPTLGTANNDDKEPVDHPDGKVQTAALTGSLGEGFDKDANPKNPFLTSTKPADAHPVGKPKTTPSTHVKTLPASAIPATTPVVATAPRVMPRRPYTDYNDGAVTAPVRTGYSRPLRQTFAPRASAPAASTSVKEKSVEERRADAIAATTFNGGLSNSAQTVASNPQGGSQSGGQGEQLMGEQSTGKQSKGEYLAAENAVLDGTPQQLINRAKKAEGVLLQGLAFTPGDLKYLEDQEITAEISDPLDSGLPVGTQVISSIKFPSGGQSQAKNAVVRLVPTAIVLNGNEYEIPTGSAILTAKNGKPFIAKRGGSEFLRFLGSATKTVLGAGTGVLTSLSGLGGGSILSSLTGLGSARGANTQSNPTEVLILKDNMPVQFSIIRPFSIPVASTENIQPLASTENVQPVAEASQPKRFAQDLSDAELMAIVNQPEETPNAQ